MEICGLLTLVKGTGKSTGLCISAGAAWVGFNEGCGGRWMLLGRRRGCRAGAVQVTAAVGLAGLDSLFSSLSAQLTSPRRMRSS